MRRKSMWFVSSFVMLAGFFAGVVPISSGQTPSTSNVTDVVSTYCSGCHNGSMRSPSGALLDRFDATQITEKADVWSRAYRQLQAGTMPPVGAPRPDRATYNMVLMTIEQEMRTNAQAGETSQEIAQHLAALLWNSAPDDSLLKDAQSNRLSEPAVLERQIHRMLADDRAHAF